MNEYWECDFYQIEEEDGEKVIHIMGYFYDTGDDDETPCRAVDYTWFDAPLKEFLSWDGDDYDEAECRTKQYVEDCTEEQAIKYMNTYFDGNPPVPLSYSDLTLDTPCGYYVNAEVTL